MGKLRSVEEYATNRLFELNQFIHPVKRMGRRFKKEISLNTDSGITRSMDIRLNSLDATQEDVHEHVRVLERKITDAQAAGGLVWEHEEKYLQLQAKVNDLNIRLNKDQDQSKAAAALPVPDTFRQAVDAKSNTAGEVQVAFQAIRDMLSDPVVLARFTRSVTWTPQVLNDEQVLENVWSQLGEGEKRNILAAMFDSLFFDREGKLVRAVAYEPFRELLGLPEDGMIARL